MSEHTEGPWFWLNYPDGRKLLVGQDQAVIHCPDAPIAILPSDAALIAAGPELLAALKGVLRVADRATVEFDAARAAIAKAEGANP